ncbi:MAG: hypothetical protein ABR512_02255 [Desulfopila sp.]
MANDSVDIPTVQHFDPAMFKVIAGSIDGVSGPVDDLLVDSDYLEQAYYLSIPAL